ncbi:MAG: substrate-binding domain-containing protein [Anaerolineae bacterium]|nr:MAG: substrate-binding domain-containing protein [Anaerolineae bacterium]
MTDNTRGARLATEHLVSKGHRRITLIGGPDHPSIIERRAGYEEALRGYDLRADGVLRKLQELGYRVPDDFSLVGFDDIILAQFTSPPITTVRVDRTALGQLAAQLLLGRINAPEREPIKTIVGVTLIERASVCDPRSQSITLPAWVRQ